jgi:hypothetical protein
MHVKNVFIVLKGVSMKLLASVFALSLSFASLADSGETRSFIYDGSQDAVELLLRGEETHTEYRYEQRRSTCYRTEVVGYRTVCTGGGYAPGPGRRPHPVPRHCRSEPVYAQVPYSCMQTVTIPYEVKDFDVEAKVLVDVKKLNNELESVEEIKVSLMGEKLSLVVNGSKKFFAILKNRNVRASINGSVKFLDALYSIELIPAAPVVNALDVNDISFDKDKVTFKLAKATQGKHLGFALNVTKRPILGSNTELLDRELSSSEYSINGNEVTIDLSNMGFKVKNGRYGITPKVFFKHDGEILNRSQFEELQVSRTLILKI